DAVRPKRKLRPPRLELLHLPAIERPLLNQQLAEQPVGNLIDRIIPKGLLPQNLPYRLLKLRQRNQPASQRRPLKHRSSRLFHPRGPLWQKRNRHEPLGRVWFKCNVRGGGGAS